MKIVYQTEEREITLILLLKKKKTIFFIDIRHVILKGERRDRAGEREREVRKKWRGGERDATYILIFFF